MTIEEMKKELARFAGQEDEAAILPQALLSIIESAESGNVGSSQKLLEIKELLSKLSSKAKEDHGEQKVANAKIIEEVNGVLTQLTTDAERNHGEQKAENTKIVEEVKKILTQLATDAEGEQKAENAKIADAIKGLTRLAEGMKDNQESQKAESAKTNKCMKIIMVLLSANIFIVVLLVAFLLVKFGYLP